MQSSRKSSSKSARRSKSSKSSESTSKSSQPAGEGEKRANAELLRQLAAAEKDGSPVQAVFLLEGPSGEKSFLDPEQTQETVTRLIAAAEKKAGEPVRALNVFRNLSSFVVEASPRLVRELLAQKGIRSATANRQRAAKSAE
jgi:hypothetical protein